MDNSLECNLIQRAKNGDANAFGPLIKLYRKRLYSYIFRLVGVNSIAEDVLQETLIKTWNGINKYSEQQKFSSWLFTIAHNCVMDEMRKQNYQKLISDNSPDELPGFDNPVVQLEKEEMVKIISETMNKLSIKQKNVFYLRIEGGFSFKEIAEITKEPLNTVLSHMNYSIKKIRTNLGKIYER